MASDDLFLGIDVGTGTTKAVLADQAGTVLWQRTSGYCYQSPTPNSAEQNPNDWWRAVCASTQALFHDYPESRSRVAAVGVSGQGVGAVFLDSKGDPLRPAILSLDRRPSADAEEICALHGDHIAEVSGKLPASYNFEPKLRWIARTEPDIWNRTWKVLTATAYITYQLTRNVIVNHSDGGICLAYDLEGRRWSEDLLGRMELPLSVYGELQESTAIAGVVTASAALESGIPSGTPVVAGGEDTSSAGLAMGVFSSGTGQLSLGTSNTVNVPMQTPVKHPRLLAFPHVIAGWTLIGGSMSSGGLAVQWITKLLCGRSFESGDRSATSPNMMDQLIAESDTISPGAGGLIFLPYLAGELQPINDGFARGAFVGLTAEMGRAHLMRAVLEGMAMAIGHNLSLAGSTGARPTLLRAVGGPTRSRQLCQIIANVVDLPIEVMHETSGAALGSAILAAEGLGRCAAKEMQRAHAQILVTIEPDEKETAIYREVFQKYVQLYPHIRRVDSDLVKKSGKESRI